MWAQFLLEDYDQVLFQQKQNLEFWIQSSLQEDYDQVLFQQKQNLDTIQAQLDYCPIKIWIWI